MIVRRSVLYISRVFGPYVLDYDSFAQHKFTCSTSEFVNSTIHTLVRVVVYFWFCKIICSVGTWKVIFTSVCLNKLVILCSNGL